MPPRSNALADEIRTIRTKFRQLAHTFTKIATILASMPGVRPSPVRGQRTLKKDGRPRKKPRLTAARRAELKLQGKYIGMMRGLKPRQRTKVKKVRAEKGIRAAIAAGKRLAG